MPPGSAIGKGVQLQSHNCPLVILTKTPYFQISSMEEAPSDRKAEPKPESQVHGLGGRREEKCVLILGAHSTISLPLAVVKHSETA